MGKNIRFKSGDIELEGIIEAQDSDLGAVICHPHPLYGGNMDNHVVLTITEVFNEFGFATLRFNFRGSGNSKGAFDDGNAEKEDVRAALSFLREKGCRKMWLAGYSFGARVNAQVVSEGCELVDHIMVSPPCGFMSFDQVEKMPDTGLIITGSRDEIAPVDSIRSHIRRWGIRPHFEVIEDGDHFYSGSLGELEKILGGYLKNQLEGV